MNSPNLKTSKPIKDLLPELYKITKPDKPNFGNSSLGVNSKIESYQSRYILEYPIEISASELQFMSNENFLSEPRIVRLQIADIKEIKLIVCRSDVNLSTPMTLQFQVLIHTKNREAPFSIKGRWDTNWDTDQDIKEIGSFLEENLKNKVLITGFSDLETHFKFRRKYNKNKLIIFLILTPILIILGSYLRTL